jgi:hypothetical protein
MELYSGAKTVNEKDLKTKYLRSKNREFTVFGNSINRSKFYSGRNKEQIETRECLLSHGAEYFVFQFAIQKLRYTEL